MKTKRTKRLTSCAVALALAIAATIAGAQTADPLPSWNDGKSKQAILTFVSKVTKEGSPEFVPPAERIATFDNDGTLWAEQPSIRTARASGITTSRRSVVLKRAWTMPRPMAGPSSI